MRVSRETLRKAIARLESERWVSSTAVGKRRQVEQGRVGRTPNAEGFTGGDVVVLAPIELEELPVTERMDHSRMVSYCAESSISMRHRKLDVRHMKDPRYRLEQYVTQNPADLYLLRLASYETQKWFSDGGVPAVVLGSTWPEFGLPSVDLDQRAIGVHAAALLRRRNHRRIGMLVSSPIQHGLELFLEGFRSSGSGLDLSLAEYDESAESVVHAIRSLVADASSRPTVLILPRVPFVLSAFGVLSSIGCQVPHDVSLLCLVYDDTLQFSAPVVSSYRVGTDAFSKAAFTLIHKVMMHSGSSIVDHSLVMPKFDDGGSLATV